MAARVLVVEDDRSTRELLRVHLRNAGHTVLVAPDALVAGRAILGAHDFDALIVNAQLPYLSGIDFVSAMIADRTFRFPPTIIIATREDLAQRAEALDVPILTAPFSAAELIELVESLIRQPRDCQRKPQPASCATSPAFQA